MFVCRVVCCCLNDCLTWSPCSCRVRGDWFQVPCKPAKTIRWLGEEALKRYLKLRPSSFVPNREEVISDIRKTNGQWQ